MLLKSKKKIHRIYFASSIRSSLDKCRLTISGPRRDQIGSLHVVARLNQFPWLIFMNLPTCVHMDPWWPSYQKQPYKYTVKMQLINIILSNSHFINKSNRIVAIEAVTHPVEVPEHWHEQTKRNIEQLLDMDRATVEAEGENKQNSETLHYTWVNT